MWLKYCPAPFGGRRRIAAAQKDPKLIQLAIAWVYLQGAKPYLHALHTEQVGLLSYMRQWDRGRPGGRSHRPYFCFTIDRELKDTEAHYPGISMFHIHILFSDETNSTDFNVPIYTQNITVNAWGKLTSRFLDHIASSFTWFSLFH